MYQLDIASEDSIAKFAKEIEKESNINLLINNAGVYQRAQGTNYKADDIRKEFNVNALGPLLLSTALLPKLKLSTFDGHHEAAIVCMVSIE